MQELLFLAHRIPYPPNKGDKIRSYHVLKYLAGKYRVHLGTFVDDEQDWKYMPVLKELCGETHFVGLNSRRARLRSAKGLLRGEALTLPYYYDASMQEWVTRLLENNPVHRVFVFSSGMAQYVVSHAPSNVIDQRWSNVRRVIDFVDVDSDKWRQYAKSKSWPMSAVYQREARRLEIYERRIAAEFDASVLVSQDEARLFKTLAPESAGRIDYLNNGVDSEYFSPHRHYANPYLPGEKVLVFTGAMDYWANVDAVTWFAQEVFPQIVQSNPMARFYIVGGHPASALKQLENIAGVHVTGGVPDVRPYLAHAITAVAPLRIARGVQNKVLEAMAMAKPVLATSAAVEGIESGIDGASAFNAGINEGTGIVVADDVAECVEQALCLLQGKPNATGRAYVLKYYTWAENLTRLDRLLEGDIVPAVNSSAHTVAQERTVAAP